MLTLKLLEWRKSIAQLCSQYREKALHVSLTICTSQRPRQNINVHSRPNLRGLRTGKPTTSCFRFCFKLNRVKNATNKRFHEQKKRSKSSARVLKTLYTSSTPSFGHQHLSCLTTGTHYSEVNAAYTCHMVCWSRGLASLEIVETFSHLLNYWDKYRFLFNWPFPFVRTIIKWRDLYALMAPSIRLVYRSDWGSHQSEPRSSFIPFCSCQRHVGHATAHTWERGWGWLMLNLGERFWWNHS